MNSPSPGVRPGAPPALRHALPHRTAAALVTLLALALVLAGLVATGRADAGPSAARAEPRTWVVDAVDDEDGNRWAAVGTGLPEVTIAAGDSVEWQFDAALTNHDLTSEDTRSTWPTPVNHYAPPGSTPFRYTFETPGQYYYLCSVHGTTMRGVVVVEEPGATNQPPVGSATLSPQAGAAPLVVHAEASVTDPDGDPLTYLWDFGTADDGSDQATTAHAMHEYTAPGDHTARLTVSDGRGGVLERTFAVRVGSDGSPVATATADVAAGPAPLAVTFQGAASAPGGGEVALTWDLGTDGATAAGPTASWTYTRPGTYVATLTATDTEGRTGTDTVDVVVGDPDDPQLPALTATATPGTGTAPLGVSLSAETTTTGRFAAFAAGTTTYPDLAGTARLERRAGATRASIEVTGLAEDAAHMVHVHERPCASENGGAHFRFDRDRPFGEANEIWLPFTSDAQGRSGPVEVTQPLRADETAVSVVVHDPDNPALRIGCADLAPSTADLTYSWDLGDGTTAQGSDLVHVYDRPGTYTARVTIGLGHAEHGTTHGATHGPTATAAVEVVVGPAPVTAAPAAPPTARVVVGPTGAVRTSRAVLVLEGSGTGLQCSLDLAPWAPCTTVTTLGPLADGAHSLRVRAVDAAGVAGPASAEHRWVVDTTAPRVRAVGPTGRTDARRPTVRAKVTDALSATRRPRVRLDGRAVAGPRLDARGRLAWTPPRPLAPGRHVVRVVVRDAVGNTGARRWVFRVR